MYDNRRMPNLIDGSTQNRKDVDITFNSLKYVMFNNLSQVLHLTHFRIESHTYIGSDTIGLLYTLFSSIDSLSGNERKH